MGEATIIRAWSQGLPGSPGVSGVGGVMRLNSFVMPASGPVTVVPNVGSMDIGQSYSVIISDIPGVLARLAGGAYQFTRTTAGTSSTIPANQLAHAVAGGTPPIGSVASLATGDTWNITTSYSAVLTMSADSTLTFTGTPVPGASYQVLVTSTTNDVALSTGANIIYSKGLVFDHVYEVNDWGLITLVGVGANLAILSCHRQTIQGNP